jgi:uncharacterized protein (TIGR02246 family)
MALAGALALVVVIGLHGQTQRGYEEESIRKLIQTFADARNAHDGAAVASLYSEDGEWIGARGFGKVKGRTALEELWGRLTGQVRRTVESVEIPSDRIAVVRVTTEYEEPVGRHHEVFIVVKELGDWKIRVHQTAD